MLMMVIIPGQKAQEAEADLGADYMESDRVMAADAGRDAFNGILDAVNTADQKMKGFTGELQRAIDQEVVDIKKKDDYFTHFFTF